MVTGLAATGLMCAFVADQIPPTYESTATATLVPAESTIAERGNPLMNLDGLILARDVLIRSLNADDVREPILTDFPDADFGVDADPNTSGPMIVVESTASAPDTASAVVDRVLDELPARLEVLQNEVESPAADRISVLRLTEPSLPEAVNTAAIRAIGAVAGAGIVATLIVTGLVDGVIGGRRQRRVIRAEPARPATEPLQPALFPVSTSEPPGDTPDNAPASIGDEPESASSEPAPETDLEPARMHQRSNWAGTGPNN